MWRVCNWIANPFVHAFFALRLTPNPREVDIHHWYMTQHRTGLEQSKHRHPHYPHQRLLHRGSGSILSCCSGTLHDPKALCHNRVLSTTEACIQEWTIVIRSYHACPSDFASEIHTPVWGCVIKDFLKEVQFFHRQQRVVPPRSLSEISLSMVWTSAGVQALCPPDNMTGPRTG